MATTDLATFLRDNPPAEKFTPYCHVSKEADALTFYFKGDADYSKRLTDHVTVFLSIDSDELVGCRIKGISGIIEDLPNYLNVNHQGVELSVVFLSFRGGVDNDTRNALNSLARAASDRDLRLQSQ